MHNGSPLRPRYLIVDSRVRIRGTELARLDLTTFPGFASDVPGSLTLWRPDGAVQLVFPGPLLSGEPEQSLPGVPPSSDPRSPAVATLVPAARRVLSRRRGR